MSGRPDFSELIRSPYEEDERRGRMAPGAALIPLIALIVGVMAGITVARAGGDEEAPVTASTTTTELVGTVTEPLQGLPEGFVAVNGDVGVKVLTTYEVQGESYVVVAGIAQGGADRDGTFMQSFGDWALAQSVGEVPAWSQTTNSVAPGMFQIRFPVGIESGASLVGTPVQPAAPTVVRMIDDAPTELLMDEPQILDVNGTEVTIDYLTYDLDEGYGVWHTGPDVPAFVEIVVTLVGTERLGSVGELPIRIGTFDSWATFLDQDVRADVPRWNTRGELRLGRAGSFRFNQELIETVTVDAFVTLATNPSDPVEIPIP